MSKCSHCEKVDAWEQERQERIAYVKRVKDATNKALETEFNSRFQIGDFCVGIRVLLKMCNASIDKMENLRYPDALTECCMGKDNEWPSF